jgi:hypothetical protein
MKFQLAKYLPNNFRKLTLKIFKQLCETGITVEICMNSQKAECQHEMKHLKVFENCFKKRLAGSEIYKIEMGNFRFHLGSL